ncbi:FAD-dependent oxidoreductase [soil metagenome]
MIDRAVSRRLMLKRSMAMAAGAFLGAGCAPHELPLPQTAGNPGRTLAPVRVAQDRLVRSVAGLRPFRASGFVVRAERLGDRTVVHNYGHGGGGISLSWGSSALAAELAQQTGAKHFAVLGSGVMGLTTARLLQDRGFEATIYARDLPPNTTSNIAGGHWSPFSVHAPGSTTPEYLQQFERAARFANRYFQSLAGSVYGVRWIENYVLSNTPPQGGGPMADLYPGRERLEPSQHPFAAPYVDRFSTMLIEPATFLNAITRDYLLRGGRVVVREIHDRRELASLPEPVIVNCTGLGSHTLFGDEELIPVKGDLAVLLPQPEVDYIVLAGEFYMFPRSDGIVLGGSRQRGEWSTEPDLAVIQRILEGHRAVFSAMRS